MNKSFIDLKGWNLNSFEILSVVVCTFWSPSCIVAYQILRSTETNVLGQFRSEYMVLRWKVSSTEWNLLNTCFSSIAFSITTGWLIALALMCLAFSNSKQRNFFLLSICFVSDSESVRVYSIFRWNIFSLLFFFATNIKLQKKNKLHKTTSMGSNKETEWMIDKKLIFSAYKEKRKTFFFLK